MHQNVFFSSLMMMGLVIVCIAQNLKLDVLRPLIFSQEIKHIENLSGDRYQIHFRNSSFIVLDANLTQLSNYSLGQSYVFKKINYYNQMLFIGLLQNQNKVVIYNKVTGQIEKSYPGTNRIIHAQILAYDALKKLIFIIESNSMYLVYLTVSQTKVDVFNVTIGTYIEYQAVNSTTFLLSTLQGKVCYFQSSFHLSLDKVILLNLMYLTNSLIKNLFPITDTNGKYFIMKTTTNELTTHTLENYIEISLANYNISNDSLLSVKYFNQTHIYFFFINSQARISLINEQLVVQEVQPYLDSPSQDSITTVVDQNSFLVSASVFDIKSMFYQVNSPYLYKFTYCQGQTAYNNLTGTCEAYQCTDATNCQSCPTNKDLCQSCIAGYEVINWKCDKICNISFCFQCETNTTCKVCQNNYNLTSDKTCVFVGNNSTNTNNNSTNNNNNSTNPNGTQEENSIKNDKFRMTKDYLITKYESLPTFVKSLTESSKTLNSFPMARILLKFLLPMFAFFDDYWFYIYHDNNSFEDFDKIAKLFSIMYVINTDRFVSQLLHTDEFLEKFGYESYLKSSYLNYTNVAIIEIDEIDTNYLRNSQEMICFQYFTTLATFFLLKLIASFFLFVKSKLNARKVNPSKEQQQKAASENIVTACLSFLSRTVIDYLEDSSQWFQLLVSFIEANLIFIGFQVGTQFFVFFSFTFLDKFNMVIAVIYGAVALFFAFIFYFTQEGDTLRIYRKQKISQKKMAKKDKKKMSKKKQVPKKYPKKQEEEEYPDEILSFRLEVRFQTYFGCLKTLVFGFLHAVLLYVNFVQLGSLLVVKIVLLIFTIKLFVKFNQTDLKWKLVPLLVYFLFGIGFDVLLILGRLRRYGLIWIENEALELMEIIILIGLLTSFLCQIIVIIVLMIKNSFQTRTQNPENIRSLQLVKNTVKFISTFEKNVMKQEQILPQKQSTDDSLFNQKDRNKKWLTFKDPIFIPKFFTSKKTTFSLKKKNIGIADAAKKSKKCIIKTTLPHNMLKVKAVSTVKFLPKRNYLNNDFLDSQTFSIQQN